MLKSDETLWILLILLPASGEHAESTTLSLPLWFSRPGSLRSALQPSWQIQWCFNMYLHSRKQAVAVWNIVLQTSYISASALIVSSPAHIHLARVRVSSVQLFWDAGAAAMVPWRKTPLLIVPSQHGGAERAKVKGAKTRGHPGCACVATKEKQSGGEKLLSAESGLEGCFPQVLPPGTSLSGHKGCLWPTFPLQFGVVYLLLD